MSKVLVRYVQYFFNVKDMHWLKEILSIKRKLPWSYIFCKFFKAENKYTVEAILTITWDTPVSGQLYLLPPSQNLRFLNTNQYKLIIFTFP